MENVGRANDPPLAEWLDQLETTGRKFALGRASSELAGIRVESAAPQAIRIAEHPNARPVVSHFLSSLADSLEEGLTTDSDGEDAPLLFVETLEFGSIRRETLQKLAALSAHPAPLLLLIVTIPARPPSAQRTILDELRAKLRAEPIPLLHLAVCDPETPGSIERNAQDVARALRRLRARELRDRLVQANRRILVDLRALSVSTRLDLESIDERIRRIHHEKELAQTRLERALRAMRAHLESELPPMAPQILDLVHEERGRLAKAALRGQELFATTLEQIAHGAIESVLSERLPAIVARAVEIFSEAAAREADSIASASGDALQSAATLTSESLALAGEIEADDVVHLIRWHDQLAAILRPVIKKNPKLALLETVIGAAAKLYIAKTIEETVDRLHEPLQHNLMHLAGVLADRTDQILLRLSREPIEALESALQSERQRQLGARAAAIPVEDLRAALAHHEKLTRQMQEWNDA
jgi:hypothetical protein